MNGRDATRYQVLKKNRYSSTNDTMYYQYCDFLLQCMMRLDTSDLKSPARLDPTVNELTAALCISTLYFAHSSVSHCLL